MYKRVELLRKSLNLSQKDFAEKIGVKQGLISAIELNKTPLTKQSIIAICSIFSVNELWLTTGKGEMFNIKSSLENDFFDVYKNFSPDIQSCLLNFAKELLNIQNNFNSKEG